MAAKKANKPKTHYVSYKKGIEWIALNDEPEETDPFTLTNMISVQLLADLFGKPPLEVALDLIKYKMQAEKQAA